MDQKNSTEKTSKEKLYLGVIAALIVVCGFLTWALFDAKTNVNNITVLKNTVEQDRNKLKTELNEMLQQYDGLKTDNKQLNDEMLAQQQQIKDLLDLVEKNKGNVTLVARYKREVTTLRTIMKGYVVTIDSLNTLNNQLVDENTQVKSELGNVKNKANELADKNQEMTGIIAKASVLKTLNLSFEAVRLRTNGKQIETDRANKTEIFKTCFTLTENSTSKAGTKTIFMRITKPDGSLLAVSTSNSNETILIDGIATNFTAKRQIEYNNKQQDVCVYANVSNELAPGNYLLSLFESGSKIGSATLNLK